MECNYDVYHKNVLQIILSLYYIIYGLQSTFISSRIIINDVFITFEIFYHLRKDRSRRYLFTLKLDISKTCDMASRSFLEDVTKKLSFDPCVIDWIMTYLTLVTYYILINEQHIHVVYPKRRFW